MSEHVPNVRECAEMAILSSAEVLKGSEKGHKMFGKWQKKAF
jgi:hypothetical protein